MLRATDVTSQPTPNKLIEIIISVSCSKISEKDSMNGFFFFNKIGSFSHFYFQINAKYYKQRKKNKKNVNRIINTNFVN